MRQASIAVNNLKLLYNEYQKLGINETWIDDPQKPDYPTDITEIFYTYIKQMLIHGRLIAIQFNGEVRDGKSTAALALMAWINKLIETLHKKEIDNYHSIVSDQNEFIRFTKTKEEHLCCEIDEFNAMGSTGSNATTEMAELQFIANVCAAQYIHRISCQPQGNHDPNVSVFLHVEGRDEENMITRCKLYYKDIASGERWYLGKIYIDVQETINSAWYARYEKKKRARIHLLQTHGLRDVRELEAAYVSAQIFAEYSPMVTAWTKRNMLSSSDIKLAIRAFYQERLSRPISMIHMQEMTEDTMTVLKQLSDIKKLKMEKETGKNEEQKKEIEAAIAAKNNVLQKNTTRWQKLEGLYHQYNNIQ